MIVLRLTSVLGFGRYKGLTVASVLKKDPEHLIDLLENYDVILGDDVRDALPENFDDSAPGNELIWEEETEWDSEDDTLNEDWEEEKDTKESENADDETEPTPGEDDAFLI